MRRRVAGAVVVAAAAGLFRARCGPLPAGFLDPGRHASTVVTDRNGVVLYESLSSDGNRSSWIAADRLPDTLVAATLAAEDRRFFRHPGIDPIATARAAWHNLRRGRLAEGGSTITQQVVKRLSGRRRSIGGKLSEALLAFRLEHRLSKKAILALYLNLAPYGNQYSGAGAASRGYFGCDPGNLTAAQAAFLAGLPQRPSGFDPYRALDAARRRQRWVLGRMRAADAMTDSSLRRSIAERLSLRREPRAFLAPHFVEEVLDRWRGSGAARIETTLDAELQVDVEGILSAQKEELHRHAAHDVAVAVLDNASGEWLAWEGSGNYFDEAHGGRIDGVRAPRQPGSTLKPFTYALAFDAGFTPASILPDLPSSFSTSQPGVVYVPRNYDGRFRGPMRAREALASSENVPAVWVLSRVGAPRLLSLLRRSGFTTLDRNAAWYGDALTMGDAEVTLGELVAAYAALAREGTGRSPSEVLRALDANGRDIPVPPAREVRLVSRRAAFWVTHILSDPDARAATFGRGGALDFPFPAAVKTGTSQAYRDNWTIGFTREVTAGVWVGNFDRTPLADSSGVTGAGPILHDVLLAAQRRALGRDLDVGDRPLATPADSLRPIRVCALSGMRSGPTCPRSIDEWLPAGRELALCDWHRGSAVAWPAAYRNWAIENGLASAPVRPAPSVRRSERSLAILAPPDGSTYLIDPTLRREFQTIAFQANAPGRPRDLLWTVDGDAIGRTSSDGSLSWPLRAGEHAVEARDGDGHRARVRITVR